MWSRTGVEGAHQRWIHRSAGPHAPIHPRAGPSLNARRAYSRASKGERRACGGGRSPQSSAGRPYRSTERKSVWHLLLRRLGQSITAARIVTPMRAHSASDLLGLCGSVAVLFRSIAFRSIGNAVNTNVCRPHWGHRLLLPLSIDGSPCRCRQADLPESAKSSNRSTHCSAQDRPATTRL